MAKTDTTKYYSEIHENKVSNFLGWKRVTGSGARSTYPGDIEGDEWLAECKTHMKRHPIEFKYAIWEKIAQEAISKFKYALYITDDGSQWVKNSWCMFKKDLLSSIDNIVILDYTLKISNNRNISFESYQMKPADSDAITVWSLNLMGEDLALMRIEDFKTIFIDKE